MTYKPSKQSDEVTEIILEWYENLPEEDRSNMDENITLITMKKPSKLGTHGLSRISAIEILGKLLIFFNGWNE